MDTSTCILTRRSVRKFEARPLPRELIEEIVGIAAYAPSWKNTQIARYTVVTDPAVLEKIASDCVLGYTHNSEIIRSCAALAVQSVVMKRSGYERDGSFTTAQGTHWESFDAGISAQTFCLAAHEKGVGTCIMGIIDEAKAAAAIGLPEGERVSALIAMGYPAESPKAPPRKDTSVLLRYL